MKAIRNNISKIVLIEVFMLFVLIGTVISNAQEINSKSIVAIKPLSLNKPLVRAVTTDDCHEVIRTRASTAIKEKEEADKKAEEATKKKEEEKAVITEASYNGAKLSRSRGSIQGPSGKETYYNLNMSGVISIMRRMGFSESEYPYNVRADGVKCLGPYVMVAAHLGKRPRGSKVQTSLGTGIVCDTGGFASSNPTQIDVATSW